MEQRLRAFVHDPLPSLVRLAGRERRKTNCNIARAVHLPDVKLGRSAAISAARKIRPKQIGVSGIGHQDARINRSRDVERLKDIGSGEAVGPGDPQPRPVASGFQV